MKLMAWCVAALAVLSMAGSALAGENLEGHKAKGFIQVGVNEGLAGFAKADEKGEWERARHRHSKSGRRCGLR